ncbi:MAG: DUF1501 domain-containing protein [Verrucomicrobia bacterium]|nr:DUF1501 domain-containing protein [Verrucomicrobiota bacterium]
MHPLEEHWRNVTRRTFLKRSGLGLGAMALGSLLTESLFGAEGSKGAGNPLAPREPHFAPRAKRVIYLHMVGAPSQLDLFDHKPELQKYDGKPCPEDFIKGKRFAFLRGHPNIAASKYTFQRHGRSGAEISELLPHLGKVADDIAIVKSLQTEEFNHAPAQLFLHTGFGRLGRPSLGSWATYGLGSENQDLPAYVVMLSGPLAGAGTSLWSPGFLPSVYQGVQFRSSGEPVLFLNNPAGHSAADRRRVLDTVQQLNEAQLAEVGDPEIATRISQYEMAFRMQTSVPELMDISQEPKATLELYGATPGKASFGNNCLLARRLVERGVRMVQLYDADWDHHADLATRLPRKCKDVDQGMAALVLDLKQRGLLDETLVVWGGEFGRTPMSQTDSGSGTATKAGRDHHKEAFTMWLAGGGVKPGITYGATDAFGYNVVENPVPVHDLNATVLHLLGLDHQRLTYRYQGRDFRLTDVHGEVVKGLLA